LGRECFESRHAVQPVVVEQIAGDLLPAATQDQIVATGFLRNSMINEEGASIRSSFGWSDVRSMDAIGKSVLGLTIQCCQCHDHKYDPFTQEITIGYSPSDDTHEANVAVYPPDQLMRRGNSEADAEIETDLQHRTPDCRSEWPPGRARSKDDQPSGPW